MSETQEKDWTYAVCPKCQTGGAFEAEDPEGAYLVVCRKCGAESSSVWCNDCGMGGDFVADIEQHPNSWACPDCAKVRDLPEGFYESPHNLVPEPELPKGAVPKSGCLGLLLVAAGLGAFLALI